MLKFNLEGGPYGDACSRYSVETDAVTLGGFINTVLTEKKDEWGQIVIRRGYGIDICVCAYEKGAIDRKASNYHDLLQTDIVTVFGYGGWGSMSYDITVKDAYSLPDQEREEFQKVYFGKVLSK